MSSQVYKSYYHVTPGRVRVRVTGIKNHSDVAKSLEILMRSHPGVNDVRANPVTGNVLVKFDQKVTSHGDILQGLSDLGHLPVLSDRDETNTSDSAFSEIGMNVGKELVKIVAKQVLKGTPVAIILELL